MDSKYLGELGVDHVNARDMGSKYWGVGGGGRGLNMSTLEIWIISNWGGGC